MVPHFWGWDVQALLRNKRPQKSTLWTVKKEVSKGSHLPGLMSLNLRRFITLRCLINSNKWLTRIDILNQRITPLQILDLVRDKLEACKLLLPLLIACTRNKGPLAVIGSWYMIGGCSRNYLERHWWSRNTTKREVKMGVSESAHILTLLWLGTIPQVRGLGQGTRVEAL